MRAFIHLKTIGLLLLSLSPTIAIGAPDAKTPNILWIITDDQRPDSLACYNQAVRGKSESALGYVSSPNSDPHERWNVADDSKYAPLADWFREKLGRIVLGDRRLEIDWSQENEFTLSDFAQGADDKTLNIPSDLIPKP